MTHRRSLFTLLVIIASASVLRAAGIFDDFWLDEIWSYNIATSLDQPADVLFAPAAQLDNNHPLNTLLIWLVGRQTNWFVYRIPSLVAGIGGILMVAIIMRRRSDVAALCATTLVALSYPLVFYSSEARGYSLAVLFALVAFDAMERFDRRASLPTNIAFVAACVFGVLSHLSFLNVYAGVVVWSVCRWRRNWQHLLRMHIIPVLFVGWLYVVFISQLTIGGSPPTPLWRGLADAICGLFAIDGPAALEVVVAIAILAGFAWLLIQLQRNGSDGWILLLVAMMIAPALAIARQNLLLPADKHQPLSARYLLVGLPFVLMAVGWLLAGLRPRRIAIAGVAAFAVLNLWPTMQFLRIGRGHYSDAVVYMSEQTPDSVITVLADNAYRTGLPLDFYGRLVPANQQLVVYRPQDDGPPAFDHGPPRWLIRHSNLTGSPPAGRYDVNGINYRFDREFGYNGLSGYSWYLYRRSDS